MKKKAIILVLFLIQTACIVIVISQKISLKNEAKSNETTIDSLRAENSTIQERLIELENENKTLGSISQRVDTVYSVEYVPLETDSFQIRTGMALRLLQYYHETR